MLGHSQAGLGWEGMWQELVWIGIGLVRYCWFGLVSYWLGRSWFGLVEVGFGFANIGLVWFWFGLTLADLFIKSAAFELGQTACQDAWIGWRNLV